MHCKPYIYLGQHWFPSEYCLPDSCNSLKDGACVLIKMQRLGTQIHSTYKNMHLAIIDTKIAKLWNCFRSYGPLPTTESNYLWAVERGSWDMRGNSHNNNTNSQINTLKQLANSNNNCSFASFWVELCKFHRGAHKIYIINMEWRPNEY